MKYFWWRALFWLVLCLLPRTAGASQDTALQVSVLIEEALQKNPRVAVAEAEWAAQKAHITQVNVLEDPVIGFDTWNIPNDLDLDKTQTWIVFAEQRIPAPGVLRSREDVAKAKTQQALQKVDVVKQAITQEVKIAFATLFLAEKSLEITDQHIGILRQFGKAAAQKFSTGSVSRQDLLRAQVALARLDNERLVQTQMLETAAAAMNTLLSRPVHTPLLPVKQLDSPALPPNFAVLEAAAFQHQAMLKLSEVAITRHQQSVALFKKERAPNFQVGLKRFENKGGMQASGWGISASVNLPWFFQEKYDGAVAEAKYQVSKEMAYYEHLKNQTRLAIQDFRLKIQTALQRVSLFEDEVIPRAEQSVASAEAGYRADQVDFLDLLESERQLLDFRLDYYQAKTEQYQQSARLEQVLGVDLKDLQQNSDGGK